MIKFIKKAFKDISAGRNLEHYCTLVFILIIFALDVFNLASPDILAEITLAVLALIVFTSLNTQEGIEKLSQKFTKPPNADEFFWKEKRSIENELAKAKNIGLMGVTLSRTLRDYLPVLENQLRVGAKVRIIIMDPDSTAPDQAVLRSKGVRNREFFVDSLRPSLERVGALANYSQSIELGLLPYKPAFGLVLIDPDEPYGRIIVEMYPHHSDAFTPTFELQANDATHWYKHFREQFDNVWNGCRQRQFCGDEIHKMVEEMRSTPMH